MKKYLQKRKIQIINELTTKLKTQIRKVKTENLKH